MVATRYLLSVAAALTLLSVAAPVQGGHPANPLQPGDRVTGPIGQCTLNFVFDGGGKVYMGIAAHCGEPGHSMSATGYNNFGTIVYDDDAITDFALIEVASAFVSHVSPVVKGHPGLPTGFTTSQQTAAGNQLKFSGYGLGFSTTTQTQEDRVGVLVSDNASSYCAAGPIIFGDSGGPVLHGPTGRALGIVSALAVGVGACSPTGATVEGALNRAAQDGFPVTLRTA